MCENKLEWWRQFGLYPLWTASVFTHTAPEGVSLEKNVVNVVSVPAGEAGAGQCAKAFVIYFAVSVSSFEAPLQYLVYLVLIVIILFRLINHNIRIKTSVCIPHISLASLAMVANGIIFWFVCVCISSCLLFLWRLKINHMTELHFMRLFFEPVTLTNK